MTGVGAPNIIAFDLSLTATGVAAGWGEEVIKTKAKDIERLHDIRSFVLGYCEDKDAWPDPMYSVDLVVLEGYAYGAKGSAVINVGELGGVIRLALYDAGIPYVCVPPACLKQYATGKGNAPKPDIRMEVFKRYGRDIADDNACDAFVLRAMALDHYGHPLAVVPASHRVALGKINWPVLDGAA